MSTIKYYSVSETQGKRILRKIAWWKIGRSIKRIVHSWPFASSLLIIFLAGGIAIGVKVMEPIHARAIQAIEAERDAARKDADACFMALRVIGEGGQVTTAGIGRPSKED